jgi:uncharacterized membrane protein YdjX (TVP38/TMEM64 family)
MAAGTKPVEEKQLSMPEESLGESEIRPSWRKILLLALGVSVLLIIVYLSPLRQYLGHLREVSERVRSFGALAPLVLMVGVAVLVGFGFPRLLFCVIAGIALGFWSGLLWAQLGTFLGNYGLFVVARAVGRDWAKRVLSKRVTLHNIIQRKGALGVVLARQLPLPGLVINLACALLPIRHCDFIVGTLVGQLPQAIPCTLIGAGALQASFAKSIGVISLAVVLTIVAWLGAQYLMRRVATPQGPSK